MSFNKKFLPNFFANLALLLTIVLVASFIIFYCEAFFKFGNLAKERFLKSPLFAFLVTPIFFWLSAYICRRVAQNAAGGGLNQLEFGLKALKKNSNSFAAISPFLNLRIAVVSATSSLIATFGGGALGREATSVHISSSIFAVAAEKFRKFLPKINLENWIFAGSAAGLAVAFNAPIAGLVYVVEKMFKSRSQNFRGNIFAAALAVSLVALILQKTAKVFLVDSFEFHFGAEFFLIACASAISGIAAILFRKTNIFFYQKLVAIKSNFWHLIPLIAGFFVATISFVCGIHSFSGGIATTAEALASAETFLSYREIFGRTANTILTFIAGCAGGTVAPAVAIGASIGSVIADLAQNFDSKIFILCGMTAFLSPIFGSPLVSAILICEAAGQSILFFPYLLFASFVSFFFSKIVK